MSWPTWKTSPGNSPLKSKSPAVKVAWLKRRYYQHWTYECVCVCVCVPGKRYHSANQKLHPAQPSVPYLLHRRGRRTGWRPVRRPLVQSHRAIVNTDLTTLTRHTFTETPKLCLDPVIKSNSFERLEPLYFFCVKYNCSKPVCLIQTVITVPFPPKPW